MAGTRFPPPNQIHFPSIELLFFKFCVQLYQLALLMSIKCCAFFYLNERSVVRCQHRPLLRSFKLFKIVRRMPEYIVGPCHIMSACSTILLDLARHNAADMWVSEMKEYLEDLTQDRDQWPRLLAHHIVMQWCQWCPRWVHTGGVKFTVKRVHINQKFCSKSNIGGLCEFFCLFVIVRHWHMLYLLEEHSMVGIYLPVIADSSPPNV